MRWATLFLFFLTSCGGLRQPDIQMPCSFSEEAPNEAISKPEMNPERWWEQFNDPLLCSLIDRSLSCNIDLRLARERICQARGLYGQQFSYLLPWVDQADSFQRMRNSDTMFETPFLGGNYVNIFQVGFDSLWEIDLFGKNIDRARAAGMDLRGQTELVRQVHVSVAAEVASLYFTVLQFNQQIRTTQEHINVEQKLIAILQDRFDAGFSPRLNLDTALAILDARFADLHLFEMLYKKSIYSLAVLLALNPEELTNTFKNSQDLPSPEGKIPLTLPSELLCRRGDVRQAEYTMAAAGARVIATRKELFPTISLASFFQYSTGFFRKLFNTDSVEWAYMPSLLMPVFQGGNIWSQIRTQTSLQRQAVLSYELSVLNALKEVENGLVGYFQTQERLKYRQEQVVNFTDARELAETLFIEGYTDFLFLIELERLLYLAKIEAIGCKKDLLIELASLFKALGGGWEC